MPWSWRLLSLARRGWSAKLNFPLCESIVRLAQTYIMTIFALLDFPRTFRDRTKKGEVPKIFLLSDVTKSGDKDIETRKGMK